MQRFLRYKPVLLSVLVLVVMTAGCIAPTEAEILKKFFNERLSEKYVKEHIVITNTYKSQVFFTIRYGEQLANTKVSGANFSGFARIINTSVVDYYGPLKEYELKIQKADAEAIFKANNCTGAVILEVGDSVQQGEADYKGIYWVGGSPPRRIEDRCTVDAVSGEFKIEKSPANVLLPEVPRK